MAHHKRRRPKHQRAGCLLCKPHKDERASKPAIAAGRSAIAEQTADTTRDDLELWYMEAEQPSIEERLGFAVSSGIIDEMLAEDDAVA